MQIQLHRNQRPPPQIQKQKPHACQMFRVKGRRCMLHSATVVGSVWRDSGHHGVTLLLRIQEPQNTLSKKTNSARQTSSHTCARWFATQWVTLPWTSLMPLLGGNGVVEGAMV